MKLLLHVCCAPCLIYPLERLRGKGYGVEGFFYNPNIHLALEYKARKDALKTIAQEKAVKVTYPEYAPAEFFQAINLKEDAPARCVICWSLRLAKTAQAARENGFGAFTTTLLVSPYQDQELLKEAGLEAAKKEGVEFYYEDFRPGFRQAHDEAKAKGIYCQKYCGCLYSELERYKNKIKN